MNLTFVRRLRALVGVAALTLTSTGLLAQEPAEADSAAGTADTLDVEEMRRQIDAITRQLEELQLGRELVVEADTSVLGLGPGVSKVYRVQQGVSVGGYGELLYENFASERQDDEPSGEQDRIDFLRAVLYTGYKFNDKLLFNSELEVEHASIEDGGEVSVEFAYLDYRFSPHVGARAGLLLAPMGFLNELHEPPTFLGTERPETERRIIPSTCHEIVRYDSDRVLSPTILSSASYDRYGPMCAATSRSLGRSAPLGRVSWVPARYIGRMPHLLVSAR